MTDQVICAPSDADITQIARSLLHANELATEIAGSPLDASKTDLERLQRVIDSGLLDRSATYSLQSLGMAFGEIFLRDHADYDWWMVEDEYGRDPALRYQKTSVLVFPRTMLSKRVEDGESVNVADLYHQLETRLAKLIDDGYH